MDQYVYRCPVCGYVHIVPGYWVSYDPPTEMEQPHFINGEFCEHVLLYQKGECV